MAAITAGKIRAGCRKIHEIDEFKE